MSTRGLPTRPVEEEALFNAAFLSLLVRSAAAQHQDRSGRFFPVMLAYVVAPLALHGPTRRALPNNVTAQMGEWIRRHPEALIDLPVHSRALLPFVSAGIRLGLTHGQLEACDSGLRAGNLPRRPRGMARSEDVDACLQKAGFLGRWFAEQPDPSTAMAWWGLRP